MVLYLGGHLVLLLLTVFTGTFGTFLQRPVSINTTLGSRVRFKCEIDSGQLYWRFNGNESVTENPNREVIVQTQNYVQSTLTIRAKAINNNLVVNCIKISSMENISAILRIQGRPSSVKNVHMSSIPKEAYAANISWEPPDMLALTSGSNIISYILTVQNHYSGYEFQHMTNETKYVFQQHEGIEECSPYSVSVQAQNHAGVGAMQRINFTFPGPSLKINIDYDLGNISFTCIALKNSSIVWNKIVDGLSVDQWLLGSSMTLYQTNTSNEQYSETAYFNPELYHSDTPNVSIQCMGLRICSWLDPYTCLTSKCRSNTISVPPILTQYSNIKSSLSSSVNTESTPIHEETGSKKSESTTPNAFESTVDEYSYYTYHCRNTIIIGTSCVSSVAALILVISFCGMYCYCKKTNIGAKTQQSVKCEDRIYESVLTLPGAPNTSDLVKTEECPAYEVRKSQRL